MSAIPYLEARLFGVTCYFTIVITFFILIRIIKRDQLHYLFFICIYLLSSIAFFFEPKLGVDLERLLPLMHYWSSLSFYQLLDVIINHINPSWVLYAYIIGLFEIDGLLPSITCFIFYSNIFYIAYDYGSRKNCSNKTISYVFLFIMSTGFMFEVISGIRNMLSFSIITRCIYGEIYNKRNIYRNLVYYLFASLMHTSGIVVSGIWFCVNILHKKNIYLKVFLIIFSACIVAYFSGTIDNVFESYKYYTTDDNFMQYYDYTKNIYGLAFFTIIFYLTHNTYNTCIKSLIICIVLISFVSISNVTIFLRLTYFIYMISIPVSYNYLLLHYQKRLYSLFFIFSLLIFMVISLTRGNMTLLILW